MRDKKVLSGSGMYILDRARAGILLEGYNLYTCDFARYANKTN